MWNLRGHRLCVSVNQNLGSASTLGFCHLLGAVIAVYNVLVCLCGHIAPLEALTHYA
jgi:hypothetical protein